MPSSSKELLTIPLPAQYYSPNTTGRGFCGSSPWTCTSFFAKGRYRTKVARFDSPTLFHFQQPVIENCNGNNLFFKEL